MINTLHPSSWIRSFGKNDLFTCFTTLCSACPVHTSPTPWIVQVREQSGTTESSEDAEGPRQSSPRILGHLPPGHVLRLHQQLVAQPIKKRTTITMVFITFEISSCQLCLWPAMSLSIFFAKVDNCQTLERSIMKKVSSISSSP